MKVIGVNTNGIDYVRIYLEQPVRYVRDPSRARAYCDEIHTWLDERFGIDVSDYIIRDVYSAPVHQSYSYAVLEMHNPEYLTMLKLAFPPYTPRSFVTNVL
jgi:hypothetical protein